MPRLHPLCLSPTVRCCSGSAAELPEEVAVTSDPDVAREDGAVLLISGHPALEGAAAGALEAGDVGRT